MFDPEKVAKAFMAESKTDIAAAEHLMETGVYSRVIYFAQQAAEKMVKACLIMKKIVCAEHKVSGILSREFHSEIPEIDEIKSMIKHLERHGTRTRYPFFGGDEMPIWVPSEEYTEEDAKDALQKAKHVIGILREFISKKYNL